MGLLNWLRNRSHERASSTDAQDRKSRAAAAGPVRNEGPGKQASEAARFVYHITEGFDECAQCHRKVGPGQVRCLYCGPSSIVTTGAHATMRETAKSLVDDAGELWAKGSRTEAITKMREAICVNPWNSVAHGNVGNFYAQLGRTEDDQFYTFEYLDRALLLGHPTPEPVRDLLNRISSGNPAASAVFGLVGCFVFDEYALAEAALAAFPTHVLELKEVPFVIRPLREPSPLDKISGMAALRQSVEEGHPHGVGLEVVASVKSSAIWYVLLHMRTASPSLEIVTSDIESRRLNVLRDVLLARPAVGYVEIRKT